MIRLLVERSVFSPISLNQIPSERGNCAGHTSQARQAGPPARLDLRVPKWVPNWPL